jgi:hypothetical protein
MFPAKKRCCSLFYYLIDVWCHYIAKRTLNFENNENSVLQ